MLRLRDKTSAQVAEVLRVELGVSSISTAYLGGSGTWHWDKPRPRPGKLEWADEGVGFPEGLTCVGEQGIIARFEEILTPFATIPLLKVAMVDGVPVVFIPLHGWRIPVSVRYEHTWASMHILDMLGVDQIVTNASVGGLKLGPYDVAVCTDVLLNHPAIYAANALTEHLGVLPWIQTSGLLCERLNQTLITAFRRYQDQEGAKHHPFGTIHVEGGSYYSSPLGAFETPAEVQRIVRESPESLVVGQSTGQEALAARLYGCVDEVHNGHVGRTKCFAGFYVVVNDAAGLNGNAWSRDQRMKEVYRDICAPMALTTWFAIQDLVRQERTCKCMTIHGEYL